MSGHSKYGYSDSEQWKMLLVTAITNSAALPGILLLYRKNDVWRAFIAFFTAFTSLMYHTLESLDIKEVFLDEGQWHRLDNIGVITCFCALFVFLMDNRDDILDFKLDLIGFFIAILAQEREPWKIEYTVVPIAIYAIMYVGVLLWRKRKPKYNKNLLKKGLFLYAFAIPCFVYALDEFTDYLRIFHGLWHVFIGIGSFYMWQLKHDTTNEVGLAEIMSPTQPTYNKLLSKKHIE